MSSHDPFPPVGSSPTPPEAVPPVGIPPYPVEDPPFEPAPAPALADTWVAYAERPQVLGNYLDGRVQVSIPVPFRGQQLEEIYLGVMLPMTAEAEMIRRKNLFEAHQTFSAIRPLKWWNLGYYQDPLTLEITAYYQYQYPNYTAPQVQWNNWPNRPPTYTDPA